ncbi:MAG: glycoside hydrolase family 127 protein [Anaerolineae bacterium]|nr:glycoside hydrolase family 127 protein [Anaerolineae bacterium]
MNTNTFTYPRPIPLEHVTIKNGFWAERQHTNRQTTIPAIYNKLEETGRVEAWTMHPEHERRELGSVVHMFWDSDTGKWLESVGYSLCKTPNPDLEAQADALIDMIEQAQAPDGYLNTYFPVLAPDKKWTNLRDWHEMYNAGHLIEGAIAYYRATGKKKILDVLSRYADHIDSKFGREEGKRHGYPGHPELELALVKLYRETGEQRYLNLATYFVNERGQDPIYFDIEAAERGERREDFWAQSYRYCQAHIPIREQTEATGHAVRACYLYAGIADVALETGDKELLEVSRRLWENLTQTQMYVTGGLGPAHSNEGFTFGYDFPNESAYSETCASISLAFWAHRMFHLDQRGEYIDVMERAIYNGSLSGISYEGNEFFYVNPLASYPNIDPYSKWSGINTNKHYRRQEWYFCPCCPPNISRLIGSIGEYTYSQTDDRVYVHLYHDNTVSLDVSGQAVQIEQKTKYPWDENIAITVQSESPVMFDLAVRIPGWCRSFELSINGEKMSLQPKNGYVVVSREWQSGDTVSLTLAMPVERVMPHREIRQDAGQIVLQRGPLIYCLEECDNGPRLANIVIPDDAPLSSHFEADLFDGTTVITGEALRVEPDTDSADLYLFKSKVDVKQEPFTVKAIPYYLWANREPGEMRVWVRSS